MRQIPSFIERGAPVHNMGVLFLATRRVSMDLESDPNLSFATRLPFGTSNTIVSCILPKQDYIAFETAEVVSHFPLIFSLPQSFDSLTTFLLPSQVVADLLNLMRQRA